MYKKQIAVDMHEDEDLEFINEVLSDEDIYWDYPVYRSSDNLLQWAIQEMLERMESWDILGKNDDDIEEKEK